MRNVCSTIRPPPEAHAAFADDRQPVVGREDLGRDDDLGDGDVRHDFESRKLLETNDMMKPMHITKSTIRSRTDADAVTALMRRLLVTSGADHLGAGVLSRVATMS